MSCEKMENVRRRRSFKERLLCHEDVADQRRPGSATSCHGPDLEWENCFRIPATGRRGVSSFTVRPTLGARMVKEEEMFSYFVPPAPRKPSPTRFYEYLRPFAVLQTHFWSITPPPPPPARFYEYILEAFLHYKRIFGQ